MNSTPTPLTDPNDAADASTPARQAVIATEERKAFWRHYEAWLLNASDEELAQLQKALDAYDVTVVQSLASVIQAVLQDEVLKREFPASFLAPLQAANWPGVATHG